MASYVAVRRIRVGDRTLEPGDPVPAPERGRNVGLMLRLGQIRIVDTPVEPVKRGPGRPRKESYDE